MAADGTGIRTVAPSIDIQGAAGQPSADWSPDGTWIVAGGTDAQGPGLFKIPLDAGMPVRIVSGAATNPVWSPNGDLILYSGALVGGQVPLLGVRPDGTPVTLAPLSLRAGAYRFLRNGKGVVYLPWRQAVDFWLLDLQTGRSRQLTQLGDLAQVNNFDLAPDGTHIVFDRSREISDIVLIERPQ
jgi:Tol biopolymer transport system component